MLFPSASAGAIVGAGSGADGCVTLKDAVLYLVFGLVNAEQNGNELCKYFGNGKC